VHARLAPCQAACPSWALLGSQRRWGLIRLGAYQEAFAGQDLVLGRPWGGHAACLADAYRGRGDSLWSSSCGLLSQKRADRRRMCCQGATERAEIVVEMCKSDRELRFEITGEMRAIVCDACGWGRSRSR
jgi:hypothetical protein